MIYSPESQVIARQLTYFANKNLLIAGELEDGFATELVAIAKSVCIFTTNFAYAKQMRQFDSIQVVFDAVFEKQNHIDTLLLYWPKAKAEAHYLLAMLMAKLGQGCEVIVIGENRSGVKSAEKLFAPYGKLTKFDAARRCSFYWGQCENTPTPFTLDDWYKSYTLHIADSKLTIRSLPGVFSYGELDKASELLLASLQNIQGEVLDFGCGAGVLGAVIKQRFPNCKISMVDISALAVQSAKETLRINGLEAQVYASDVYSDVKKQFDHIISNPPFHAGLKTHYQSTENMLKNAPNHLKDRGKLTIVANNFLQYPSIIENVFAKCQRLDKNNRFSVYQACK